MTCKDVVPYEIFDINCLDDMDKEYSKGYRAFRKRKRKKILLRIYGKALNQDNIITKYIIEDVVFDNYLT